MLRRVFEGGTWRSLALLEMSGRRRRYIHTSRLVNSRVYGVPFVQRWFVWLVKKISDWRDGEVRELR